MKINFENLYEFFKLLDSSDENDLNFVKQAVEKNYSKYGKNYINKCISLSSNIETISLNILFNYEILVEKKLIKIDIENDLKYLINEKKDRKFIENMFFSYVNINKVGFNDFSFLYQLIKIAYENRHLKILIHLMEQNETIKKLEHIEMFYKIFYLKTRKILFNA